MYVFFFKALIPDYRLDIFDHMCHSNVACDLDTRDSMSNVRISSFVPL